VEDSLITDNNSLVGKTSEIPVPNDNYLKFVMDTARKTIKQDDSLLMQILCTGLSSRSDEPLNLAIIAPTSEGKTYPVVETMKYFPKEQVWYIGKMSPKVLVRQRGVQVDSNTNMPVDDNIRKIKHELSLLGNGKGDKKRRAHLKDELTKLLENSKTVIDLSHRIIIFLEPPDPELWEIIKPILSHDTKEIDYPFVDKEGMQAKNITIRGWPACIVCSAKDESKETWWPEIASRFLIVSPNMIPTKYHQSNLLVAQKAGLPGLIQEGIIISPQDIELAKECIIHIEDEMSRYTGVWIPYHHILANALPAEKGTDTRAAKKIFSLLRILPLIQSEQRYKLEYENEGERLVIASLEDLSNVLYITRNTGNVPTYKMKFYNEVFLPCCSEELSNMVTSRQICDYIQKTQCKTVTTDNLKKTYLDELVYNGVIEQIDNYDPVNDRPRRDKLYSPQLSNPSNLSQFDGLLHKHAIHNNNICIFVPDNWLELQLLYIDKPSNSKFKILYAHTGIKGGQNEEIEKNVVENERIEENEVQIGPELLCVEYEKNEKLIRYFLNSNFTKLAKEEWKDIGKIYGYDVDRCEN
jgi:hypothetical protein